MGPEIETCREVEIRYGYSIRDDLFYAHFDLPSKDVRGHFQSTVRADLSPVLSEGKQRVTAHSDVAVLELARAAIDRYFED